MILLNDYFMVLHFRAKYCTFYSPKLHNTTAVVIDYFADEDFKSL